MTPEDILSHQPRILTQQQREFYFKNGLRNNQARDDGRANDQSHL